MVDMGQIAGAAAAAASATTSAGAATASFSSQLSSPSSSPFSSMMRTMMAETSSLETQANQAIQGVLNGSGVELHQAMIATQKADMAFELALQVRNKAVAAYQQMMSMQF